MFSIFATKAHFPCSTLWGLCRQLKVAVVNTHPINMTDEGMTFTLLETTSAKAGFMPELTTTNGTDIPPATTFRSRVVIYLIISFVIIFGNAIVITAVLRYRFLQTPTNLFVVGVSSVDLTNGIFGALVAIQTILPGRIGQFSCLGRIGCGCVNLVSTAMMLAGMSVYQPWLLYCAVPF